MACADEEHGCLDFCTGERLVVCSFRSAGALHAHLLRRLSLLHSLTTNYPPSFTLCFAFASRPGCPSSFVYRRSTLPSLRSRSFRTNPRPCAWPFAPALLFIHIPRTTCDLTAASTRTLHHRTRWPKYYTFLSDNTST